MAEEKHRSNSANEHTHPGEHTHAGDGFVSIKCEDSVLKDRIESEHAITDERLARAVQDAGEYAYGVVAVEVWVFQQTGCRNGRNNGRLVRPKGGWWRNPLYEAPGNEGKEALLRIEDPSHEEYISADSLMPGVCLAGTIWGKSSVRRSISRSGKRTTNRSILTGTFTGSGTSAQSKTENDQVATKRGSVVWWDINSILCDPDSAKTPRLALLKEAGFGEATGITFDVRGHRGIVLYLARTTASQEKLSSPVNIEYMRRAADQIGTASALVQARRASVESKNAECAAAWRKFRRNLIEFKRNRVGVSFAEGITAAPDHSEPKVQGTTSTWAAWCRTFVERVKMWYTKCKGGSLQIPPPMTVKQTLWTILGAFCGLLTLSSLNEYIKDESDNKYFILLGPFGALMTLQYGLTAAPASQPWNAVLGQAVAGAVALSFTYIPDSVLEPWLRQAVGPAFAIGAMVKLGIPHPPAGAHSVLYSSGDYGWVYYGLVVLSSAVSVVPAIVVNNMSEKRQYPTYWGYGPSSILKLAQKTRTEARKRKANSQTKTALE